jgi:hypothetical protein
MQSRRSQVAPLTCIVPVAMMIAAIASADEPIVSDFKSYTLPTYTLITRDSNAVRRVPTMVARADGLLAKLFNRETRHAGVPAYILVVPHKAWMRYFKPGKSIIGEFLPARFANYILLDSSFLGADGYDGIYHEYTHFYLWTQIRGVHPLWFDEGLAVLIENTTFSPSTVKFELPWSAGWSWSMSLVPMERLLSIDKRSPEYRTADTAHSVHLQSWAMVHRGVIADRAFGKQMFAFLAALNEMQPVDRAVQSSFGMTTDQLDSSMRNYVRNLYLVTAKLEHESPPPVSVPPGRDLSEIEVMETLAEVMFSSGYQPQNLASLSETARSRAPESTTVLALRMRLAIRDRDDLTLRKLLADVGPRLYDASAARIVGLAIFERVRNSDVIAPLSTVEADAMSRRAFELLQRALAAESNDLEALCAYATLAARLKQNMAIALERIQKLRTLQPSNGDLAMAAALLLEAQGDSQGLTPYLVDIIRFSNWDDQRKWAALRLGSQHNAQ